MLLQTLSLVFSPLNKLDLQVLYGRNNIFLYSADANSPTSGWHFLHSELQILAHNPLYCCRNTVEPLESSHTRKH